MKITGFSIITNFGCNMKCPYCIWNNHSFRNIKTSNETMNWEELNYQISLYQGNKINVSGGGDPFCDFQKNSLWWGKLLRIVEDNGKLLDVHTRIIPKSPLEFFKKINKIVLSFDNLEQVDNTVNFYLNKNIKLRLTKVIQQNTTEEEIKNIIEYSSKNNCQLTFKELYGMEDGGTFEQYKKLYESEKVVFLEQGDYNIYFMPDNKLYQNFYF